VSKGENCRNNVEREILLKRKRSEEYNLTFQHWRDVRKREGLKMDAEVALFLLDM